MGIAYWFEKSVVVLTGELPGGHPYTRLIQGLYGELKGT